MKKLVDEHVLIKRWIATIPEVIKNLDVESEKSRQLILDGIDMIRSYADKYENFINRLEEKFEKQEG
jgi:hemerythrin-like domain-containing protein